jgi:hypothetical protein
MSHRMCGAVLVTGCAVVMLAGCSSGSLATSGSTLPGSTSAGVTTIAGPTVIVTVPDLLVPPPAGSAPVATPAAPVASADPVPGVTETTAQQAEPEQEQPAASPEVSDLPTDAQAPAAVTDAPPATPPGDALNVSLANCDGCTVLATHRGVAGDLSAALVGTGSGRAVLLSVGADGSVAGVIGVPYGAAFPAPDGGVLACEQARCVVQGRQSDGRAILSAFELTGSGAWRDVSGDDAFPSATERAAVVELGGQLGIAVQDQADGPAVWMLYRWDGDGGRFAVVGCAPDGTPPASLDAVTPSGCLS